MMPIKDIRAITGLSQAKFADKYKIPVRNISNWELPEDNPNYRKCPVYVNELLERVVEIDFKSE